MKHCCVQIVYTERAFSGRAAYGEQRRMIKITYACFDRAIRIYQRFIANLALDLKRKRLHVFFCCFHSQ